MGKKCFRINCRNCKEEFRIKKPARTNQFDAGAAWENLALEATFRGLATHAMQGFDYEKAIKELEIPDNFDVLAMIAIGRKAPRENLPP